MIMLLVPLVSIAVGCLVREGWSKDSRVRGKREGHSWKTMWEVPD